MDQIKKEYLFQDYKAICSMHTDIKSKIKMLSILLYYNNPYAWRIVGITPDALSRFKAYNFRYVAKMGINRAHIHSRNELYKHMIESPYDDFEKFWKDYIEKDITVFSTSSENIRNTDLSHYISMDIYDGLFQNRGYIWKHGKEEENFLRNLYQEFFKSINQV